MAIGAVIREFIKKKKIRQTNLTHEARSWSNRQNSGDQQTKLWMKTTMRRMSKTESRKLDKEKEASQKHFQIHIN